MTTAQVIDCGTPRGWIVGPQASSHLSNDNDQGHEYDAVVKGDKWRKGPEGRVCENLLAKHIPKLLVGVKEAIRIAESHHLSHEDGCDDAEAGQERGGDQAPRLRTEPVSSAEVKRRGS